MLAELIDFNYALAEASELKYPIAIVDGEVFQSRTYTYSPFVSDFELAKRARLIGKKVEIKWS